MTSTKFWIKDPLVLIRDTTLLPNSNMNYTQKLNSLTVLLLIITFTLYILGYDQYKAVLILGIVMIIFLYSYNCKENFEPTITEKRALNTGIRNYKSSYDSRPHVPRNQACWFNQGNSLINMAYEVTPPIQFNHFDDSKRSYMNAKYELTSLRDTDGFRQIWRNEPEYCGGYSMIPDPLTEFPVEQPESRGQCNYIVRSRIDHLPVSESQTNLNSTRAIAEESYNKSMLDFRSSIMNEHIDRFRRERQHNCADMKLNAFSAGSGGPC